MFPYYYKKDVVKLIHLLSDDPNNYYVSSKDAEKFDKLLQKIIILIEDIKNGSNN